MGSLNSNPLTVSVQTLTCSCPAIDVCANSDGSCPAGYMPDPDYAGCCMPKPLPAKFNISPSFTETMDVGMLCLSQNALNIGYPTSCYYVTAYIAAEPCCGLLPVSGVFMLSGIVEDDIGNPVPSQAYNIYMLNSDPYMTITDLVTLNSITNPTYTNPLHAQSDANGNMQIEIVYSKYPAVNTNSNNYPSASLLNSCVEGNVLSVSALNNDTIAFVIPNTAIQGSTSILFIWNEHYIASYCITCFGSCPKQSGDKCL